jgi:phosphopantothenoylcysteine decarboxylase
VIRNPVGMTSKPVLYVIVCACPPARHVDELIQLAQDGGWDACVLTTPLARRFVNAGRLTELTGHPVRSEYKHPGEPDVLPSPDAIIVAPATVNTINKWGAGICDTLALGIIVEAIGLKLPIVAVPHSNKAHTAHPAFIENVERLRSWSVTVLWGDSYPSHEPGTGTGSAFPWKPALDAIGAMIGQRP